MRFADSCLRLLDHHLLHSLQKGLCRWAPQNERFTRPSAETSVKQAVTNSHVVDAKQGMVAHKQERRRVNRDVIQACKGRKALEVKTSGECCAGITIYILLQQGSEHSNQDRPRGQCEDERSTEVLHNRKSIWESPIKVCEFE